MRYNRTSKALVLSAALALTLTACGGGGGNEPEPTTGGDSSKVITANSTEPQNGLLPANTNEVGGGRVMDLLFTGLVSYDIDGKPVNELAESIETTDAKLYTIKIKTGQKFTNGEAVTAKSFVDAWNFGAAAKNAQLNSYFFESIKGYADVSAEGSTKETMEGLKVVDDTTFTVELSRAESDFPLRLGYTAFYPLPAAAFEDPKAFGEKPAGNGPYKLAEDGWKHNVQIDLVPNADYSGPRTPANGGVTFKIYTTFDAAYQDLLGNNLDVLDQIPPSALQNYKDDLGDRWVNQAYAGNATMTIASYLPEFKGEAGALRRQAISMSIDRQQIIDTRAWVRIRPTTSGSGVATETGRKFSFHPPGRDLKLYYRYLGLEQRESGFDALCHLDCDKRCAPGSHHPRFVYSLWLSCCFGKKPTSSAGIENNSCLLGRSQIDKPKKQNDKTK